MSGRVRWGLALGGAGLGGVIIGAVGRGFSPPFVLDDPFWRAFWSGPPVAGLFAIAAAAVAFFPAYRSTGVARETAAREQWWNRAKWALELANSDVQSDREVANDALEALVNDATKTEAKMLFRTIVNLQNAAIMDNTAKPKHNGIVRRLFHAKDHD